MLEVQKSTLDMAGATRLDQIRASMAGEQLAAAPQAPAVEAAPADDTPAPAPVNTPGVARLDEIRASIARGKSGEVAAGEPARATWRQGGPLDARAQDFRPGRPRRPAPRRGSG